MKSFLSRSLAERARSIKSCRLCRLCPATAWSRSSLYAPASCTPKGLCSQLALLRLLWLVHWISLGTRRIGAVCRVHLRCASSRILAVVRRRLARGLSWCAARTIPAWLQRCRATQPISCSSSPAHPSSSCASLLSSWHSAVEWQEPFTLALRTPNVFCALSWVKLFLFPLLWQYLFLFCWSHGSRQSLYLYLLTSFIDAELHLYPTPLTLIAFAFALLAKVCFMISRVVVQQ